MSTDVAYAYCEAAPTSVQSEDGRQHATVARDGGSVSLAKQPSQVHEELEEDGSAVAVESPASTDLPEEDHTKSTEAGHGEETDGDPRLALAGAIRASANGDAHTANEAGKDGNAELGTEAAEETGEEGEREYYCGVGPWHPPWLQWLRDARVFTALLCLFSAVEGALVSGALCTKCILYKSTGRQH